MQVGPNGETGGSCKQASRAFTAAFAAFFNLSDAHEVQLRALRRRWIQGWTNGSELRGQWRDTLGSDTHSKAERTCLRESFAPVAEKSIAFPAS